MKDSIKISRKTKSAAYRFIKSLMKDGVEGEYIHNLVAAISDNVNSEVGGEILADLIRNAKDENAEVERTSYWFGPIGSSWYAAITDRWADICEDNEIRGSIRIGGLKAWKDWNKQGNKNYTDKELKERVNRVSPQIIRFNWTSDAIVTNEIRNRLTRIHDQIKKFIDKEDKK